MRIIFLASGEFAVPTLRWLANSDHEIARVITQPPRKAGRGKRLTPTPVHQMADELGLHVVHTENVNTDEFIEETRELDTRLGVVIAFGQKLGDAFMNACGLGCVNLHASILPKYRGAAPINWALIRGETTTGVTVFRIVEAMDAGPILITRTTAIKPEETAGELHDRLAGIGVDAVHATLDLFADGANPAGENQDHAAASKAPKLKKKDGYIDFDQPARAITCHIAGMTPWPGASTDYHADDGRWERLSIVRARVAEPAGNPDIAPGTLDKRLYVAAADAFVELLEVKPSSGRIMTWQEYVNGRHVQAGHFLEPPA